MTVSRIKTEAPYCVAIDKLVQNHRFTCLDSEDYFNLDIVKIYLRSALFFIKALKRIKRIITKKTKESSLTSVKHFREYCTKNINGSTSSIMYFIYQIGRNIEKILLFHPSLLTTYNDRIHWEEIVELGYNLKKEMVNVENIEGWMNVFSKLTNFVINDIDEIFSVFILLTNTNPARKF